MALATLTSPAGPGVLLADVTMEVAVENSPAGVILSHNALISGRGNKGVEPESSLNAAQVKHIAGQFALVPLGAAWPALLTSWLGPRDETAIPWQPFYHSYDQ